MIGVELFAGAGGMSLGAEIAGIEVRAAVELNPAAAATYAYNHPNVLLYNSDIRTVDKIDIGKRSAQLIVFGGPPCQGFSTSNQRTRNTTNPNNWLFTEFLRIIDLLKPEWVIFENVAGIMQTERGKFVLHIETALKLRGYSVSFGLLNAVDAGVPQQRVRFFLIGSLNESAPDVCIESEANHICVCDAINDLPALEPGANRDTLSYDKPAESEYANTLRGAMQECTGHLVTKNSQKIVERYKHIPAGGNWKNIPLDLMESYTDVNRCHTGIYKRLSWNAPSIVLGNFRKNMLVHPSQHRGLSVREAARLQSFPDCYRFLGSIGFQQQQVGNAVPPKLAASVFRLISGDRRD